VGQSFLCSFFSQVAVVATADAPFEQKNLCRTFTGASATFRVPILGLDMSLMRVDTLAEAVGFPILLSLSSGYPTTARYLVDHPSWKRSLDGV
jgi:hypothetical protein